ncbi:MAG: rRNA maturation RNAse YbeY, partial [Candidatus Zixiibacteriota bacterium]
MMKLCIYKEIDCRLPLKNIKFLFGKLTKKEAKDNWNGIINLIFTSDERMKSLNKQFRAKNRTTDVLSFNIDEPVSDESVF